MIQTRHELFNYAKKLTAELGLNVAKISAKWNHFGTTKAFWRMKIRELQSKITKRNNTFNKTLKLARLFNQKISIPIKLSGTDEKVWKKENARLLRLARQDMEKLQNLKQARTKMRVLQEELKDFVRIPLVQRKLNKTFGTLIAKKDFQTILSLVVSGAKLSEFQIIMFMNTVRAELRRYVLTFTLVNGLEQTIPFNANTTNFIKNFLKNGLFSTELQSYGSDVIQEMIFTGIRNLVIEEYEYFGKSEDGNSSGQFFPYINNSDFDLSRYQVFNQEQAESFETHKNMKHCFIKALENTGIKEHVLNRIALGIQTGAHFAKKHIKNVAQEINCKIIIHTYTKKKIKKVWYGKGEEVNIALYKGHYFTFEKTIYSKFSVINYEKLKKFKNIHDIVRLHSTTRKPVYGDSSKISSLAMIKLLHDNGLFSQLNVNKFLEASTHKETRDLIFLDNIENEQREVKFKPKKKPKRKIFYADTETFVFKRGINHELFLLGCCDHKEEWVNVYTVDQNNSAQSVVNKWLRFMTRGVNKETEIICYFHNLRYDYNVMEPFLNVQSKVEKDNQLYAAKVRIGPKTIELRDSFKMVPFALKDFGKEFNLPKHLRKKEAIAYKYYTPRNIYNRITVEEYSKYLNKKDRNLFLNELLPSIKSFDPKTRTFSPYEYFVEYLKMDCEVLKEGLKAFNICVKNITDDKMSAYDALTISSLTDHFSLIEGAYQGVYEVSGNLRQYVAKGVYGGRVCANEKYKKKVIKAQISDYDGVSLYPSAIARLCIKMGVPLGKAKRFSQEELTKWKQKDYCIVTVKINKVNKEQEMPFIAHREDGVTNYKNEPPPEPIVIDKISLEDYINFHEIEYDILDGVYWDEGFNPKLGEIIRKLFNERLYHKKVGNDAMQNTLKLMMNSEYGKTILKKSKTEKFIISRSENIFKDGEWIKTDPDEGFRNYVCKNFHIIKSIRKVNDYCYEIEQIKSDFSYNRGHVGCAILSMSKRIMNEVFDVANTEGLPIYYQDTDSMHIDLKNVPKLEKAYKEKYGRELNGKQMGQFHTDFSLEGAEGEIYASKSIFLGKKSYLDVLESVDKNGNKITGHHIRLKGVTKEGLLDASKRYGSYETLYEKLAKGESVDFVLNPYNKEEECQKTLFHFFKGGVRTKKEFIRHVSF
jgi:hypothetical protein